MITTVNERELLFAKSEPFWHAYTDGRETTIIFQTKEDYDFAINALCLVAFEYKDVKIIAAEIMSNHVHLLLSGNEYAAHNMCQAYERKLRRAYAMKDVGSTSHEKIPRSFKFEFKKIENISNLRYTIVYINRNAFVAARKWTPYNYPWGTGIYYFMQLSFNRQLKDYQCRELRQMFRSRVPNLPDDLFVIDGHVALSSFCDIELGMSMFRDPQHYFSMLYKNVEAYSEIARSIDDSEYMSDTELFEIVSSITREQYRISKISELTAAQRIDVAKSLHYDYHSSNGQIRRILGMSQFDVDSLFPLSAKR